MLVFVTNEIDYSHHRFFYSEVKADFDGNNVFFLALLQIYDLKDTLIDLTSEKVFIRVP